MKKLSYLALFIVSLLTTSCTTSFIGSVFVFNSRDILLYIILAFVFAILLGLQSENQKKTFWLWFVLGVFLTPLTSFVALLIKVSK